MARMRLGPWINACMALVGLGLGSAYFSCSNHKDVEKPKNVAAPAEGPSADPAAAGTLELSPNPLAVAYPEGLSVAALPQDKVETDAVASGQVAVETNVPASLTASSPSLGPIAIGPGPGPGSGAGASPPAQPACLVVKDGKVTNPAAIQNIDPTKPCVAVKVGPAGPDAYRPFKESPRQKLKAARDRLDGTADRCFSADIYRALTFEQPETEGCYQFDYGIMQGASCTTGEACMVAYSREVVSDATSQVESALDLVQAMLCQARKEGVAVKPLVGETKDFMAHLGRAAAADAHKPTFTKAQVSRLADVDGRPVYKSEITLSVNGREHAITVAHSPAADGTNDTYNGVIAIRIPAAAGAGPLATALDSQLTRVLSVRYSRSGSGDDTRVKMEVRSARMKTDRKPFAKTGEVDFNAGADFSGDPAEGGVNYAAYGPGGANEYVSGMASYAFDINPLTAEGQLSFWRNPGGNYFEAARGFVFNVGMDKDTGYLEGCAVAGAASLDETLGAGGISIRRVAHEPGKTLAPRGYFTPFVCDEQGHRSGTTVWKQCFKQTDAGIYVVDETKTPKDPGYARVEAAAAAVTDPELPPVASVGDISP